MRNSNIFGYILLIVLILLIAGAISIGDVVNFLLYIILGVVLIVVIGIFALRIKLNRIRKELEKGTAGNYRKTYRWGRRAEGEKHWRNAQETAEGNIEIRQAITPKSKLVKNDVGDYADYEEITEDSNV